MTAIASAPQSFSILLFGSPQISIAGHPLVALRSRKAVALLALLALRHGRTIEREWLASTLWPDAQNASANLRPVLSELRQALQDQAYRLQSPNRHTLLLDLADAEVDVLMFDAAIAGKKIAALTTAVMLYRGPLLEDSTEEWAIQEREARKQDCLRALDTLAENALAAGDYPATVDYCRRALGIDAWWESARRRLMEALAKSGSVNEALQVYREFVELLKSDPHAAPDEATSALYRRLREQVRQQSHKMPDAALTVAKEADGLAVRGNLPHPLTGLIGREDERIEVATRLRRSRLVTLTGPGGIGKTRLAIEVAGEIVEDSAAFPDGVWLVALESLLEDRQVLPQIASALGLREETGRSLLESLTDHLRAKRLLLVLDNCEHLLEVSSQVVARLLQECARVRILATSREALAITGETAWQVPALPTPDKVNLPLDKVVLLPMLMSYESVQLFVERAQAVQQGFALTGSNALAVAQVCSQLEGIPLAIELAAARVKAMTVEQIAVRLHNHLSLLTGVNRAVQSRQQTLRATLDWSYELLSPPECLLLCRLAVFIGGLTLEAAEDVCPGLEAGANEIQKRDVLNLLTSLVDKSLVAFAAREAHAGEEGGRYRLLETVRQYAVEKLQASGETNRLKTRHRNWFVSRADAEATKLTAADPQMALRRLETDYDNLRAALAWCEADAEGAEAGLRLAGALGRFLYLRGYYSEGRKHLERALGRQDVQTATGTRARALNGAGVLASTQGEYAWALTLFEESLNIYRQLNDKPGIAVVTTNLGIVYYHLDQYAAVRALYEESLRLHRELEDSLGVARTLNSLGTLASRQGDYTTAQALLAESLNIRKKLGDRRGIAVANNNLGTVAMYQGDYKLARALYEEGLHINKELEDPQGVAVSLVNMGNVARNLGEYIAAQALYAESLKLFQELGHRPGIASVLSSLGETAQRRREFATARHLYAESLKLFRDLEDKRSMAVTLDGLAIVLASQAEVHKAVSLWGAATALRETLGVPFPPEARTEYDQQVKQARAALGDNFDTLWEKGRVLSWEQAVASALEPTGRGS